ncbi:hypothetical protein LOTGIDRAFT_212851 [Lottia gigantea]|uniref:Structural maintenance of chromosomes protein n=1 Tax=Lottia gigantea TaxID=225164 RepID=V4B1T6_LOTGI|nr:hypothetical protein LOTGIDRAFT_212851 [Lottia gigantea]ESP01316.1 hypothetical protein LOTGIDRAFT_212851 [Lottia gigantea]
MYIKSMVVDGFKSYAQRTEINGFDPLFNAITGLNGSGKSNILDAICFLLGITNLTHVRAGNLQDLVYKCGQAGVSKATVSITFDNKDKKQSPFGYEQYEEITVTRQVVIGGRNKYLINGSNANNTRVQDLFHSVQLNVNNPHFLIMQGRITKVLNMKPPEILSLIEEAAGTRLYESKKESVKKTIEKKDAKLREIESVLNEDITPTLSKLREERSSYLEYQKIIRELDHLNKLYIAYTYVCAEEKKKRSHDELNEITEQTESLKTKITNLERLITDITESIVELEKKRDEASGSAMEKCESVLKEKQKEFTLCQSGIERKKESLKAEEKKKKQLMKNCDEDKKTLNAHSKQLESVDDSLSKLKEEKEASEESYKAAQKHLHAVTVGLSSNDDGNDASLTDQLISAEDEISTANTDILSAQNKLKHFEKELKQQESGIKHGKDDYKKDQTLLENIKQHMTKLENEIKKTGYEEGQEEKLATERRNLIKEVEGLNGKLHMLQSRFPHLNFEYSNPESNFDRSKVKGLVCKLIQVKNERTATSLEVAAGGKLYNVVVDTEVTAKKLLQKGELKKRYTFIPINKISSRSIDPQIVKKAENLVGKENVSTALSLVGYEKDLQTAMQYVFGSCFICPDMDTAKKVTYNDGVLKKTVTFDGDSFDPAGTLTGGARKQNSGILQKLQEIKEVEDVLKGKESEVKNIDNELTNLKKNSERYVQFKREYDLKKQEADLVSIKLEQNTHHKQLQVVNSIKESIAEQKNIQTESEEKKKKATQKVKELKNKLQNAKAVRENELKEAEDKLSKAKKKMEDYGKKLKDKLQDIDGVKLEAEELKKEISNNENQLKATEEAIEELKKEIEELLEGCDEQKLAVTQAQEDVNKQKELLKSRNKEITEKVGEQRNKQKELKAAQLEIQDLEHKISKHQKDTRDAVKLVESMLQEYDWIAEEKKYFGQPNTSYDFKVNDPKEAERRISNLTATKEKLSKNVNMRAMNMLGKAEEQYNDLIKKRQIVLNDKAKIASVIIELDEKKNEALKKAWSQVNKDFNSIFSSLLPGTQAKLSPPDGKTVLDGLEVKVAFADVWKESLSELSGGQRSLVALSLILSLLLFKPAPIYILDEVDAALDLSHTQNIGQMIKSHFQHSQFIVVSLKDGMFTNANILFKTKFIDGVSTVTRHVQQTSKPNAITANKQKEKQKQRKELA